MVGRLLSLSVPWSLKMSPRAEGRPMGPATPLAFDSSSGLDFWLGVRNLVTSFSGRLSGIFGGIKSMPLDLTPFLVW